MHRAPRALRTAASAAALALVGALGTACGAVRPAADTGLNKDLALADQVQRLNAPTLVVPQDSTPAAPAATAPAVSARILTHTVVRTRVAAPSAARSDAPATVAAQPRTPHASAGTPTDASATGAYDAGRASGGEVADAGPSAPADGGSAGSTAPGAYGADLPVERRPQAHTARDGVLAAVAGAVIGAAASPHDRVRGGLIGAVAGGALGAVYGHSADRTYPGYEPPSYRTYTGLRRYPTYRSGY